MFDSDAFWSIEVGISSTKLWLIYVVLTVRLYPSKQSSTWSHIKLGGLIESSHTEARWSKWVSMRREECVWCCQHCLPVGSHFLHRSRVGLQSFRPSRNSPHNLPFIEGQSDAGSWHCTDACVLAWPALPPATQMAAWMFVAVSVCLLRYHGNVYLLWAAGCDEHTDQ